MNNFLNVVSVRLVQGMQIMSEKPVKTPEDAVELVGKELCEMDREVVCVINLQADNKPINCHFASVGGLSQSQIYPREIFKASILSNAAYIILMHNHPSGSVCPSKEDNEFTDRMAEACKLMGIPLLDHIIVGTTPSNSFSYLAAEMLHQ